MTRPAGDPARSSARNPARRPVPRSVQGLRTVVWGREHRPKKPWADPVTEATADPGKLSAILARPEAERRLVIMFTPRSGSSRLTDILKDSGTLGTPGEYFNPGFIGNIARAFGAGNLDDYTAALLRRRVDRGTFSCEATYRQMRRAFGTEARFLAHLRPTHWAWLVREDIVAQAVSASRQIQTRVRHDTGLDREKLDAAENRFVYDADHILRQFVSIRDNETATERMFRQRGIRPLRLSYERLSPLTAAGIAPLFARLLDVPLAEDVAYGEVHRKIGTNKNLDFARRFRREHFTLVRVAELARWRMLRRLDDLPA